MALTQVQGGMTSIPVSGTAVTASGTSVDFTGIPSWVKRITVMLSGVSLSGTSQIQIQLGSGSVDATGYSSSGAWTYNANGVTGTTSTTGLLCTAANAASSVSYGSVIISNMGSNIWVSQGVLNINTLAGVSSTAGSKTLSGTLDRIRITTVNGTDTFDAGTINIMYE